jgi:hypothetical protein
LVRTRGNYLSEVVPAGFLFHGEEAAMVKELRAALKADGRSLTKLAELSRATPGQLSKFCRGRCGLYLTTAERLAAVLGLSLIRREGAGASPPFCAS